MAVETDMTKFPFIVLLLTLPVLTLAACNVQNKMLYFPGTYVPSRDRLEAANMRFWPDGPDDYRGFLATVPIDRPKGTVLVFHGNAATAADRDYYIRALSPLGYRVILTEYPGYGGRPGTPGEAAFVRDARETARLAFERYGGPLYLLGESLGCGVAAAAAKDSPVRIDGLILITPWDTLLSVAREKFPWVPVGLFLKDKYDTVGNLKPFQGKIAIAGAERDEVIPFHHARDLYATISGNGRLWTIQGAGHNDWPDAVGRAWWQDVTGFVSGKET